MGERGLRGLSKNISKKYNEDRVAVVTTIEQKLVLQNIGSERLNAYSSTQSFF